MADHNMGGEQDSLMMDSIDRGGASVSTANP